MDTRSYPIVAHLAAPLRRALVFALCAWLVTAYFTALLVAGSPVRAATHTVMINGLAYSPATLTIAVGDTVTWMNNDVQAHTATASGGAFDSGTMIPGQSFSFTFTTAGSFAYTCNFHAEMTGTITVQAAAAPTTTAAQSAAPAPAGPATTSAATAVPNTSVPAGDHETADASGVPWLVAAAVAASAVLLGVAAWRRRAPSGR
jgi:plastocyanin